MPTAARKARAAQLQAQRELAAAEMRAANANGHTPEDAREIPEPEVPASPPALHVVAPNGGTSATGDRRPAARPGQQAPAQAPPARPAANAKMPVAERLALVANFAAEHQPSFTRKDAAAALGCSETVIGYTASDPKVTALLRAEKLVLSYSKGTYTVTVK